MCSSDLMLERSWLHADCGATLLRPCPLQFCLDWLRPEDLALIGPQCIGVDPKRSLASLTKFYQRIGYTALSLPQLKILQEVISLSVFAPFALFYMGQPLKLDYLWACLCLLGAVYFIFRS